MHRFRIDQISCQTTTALDDDLGSRIGAAGLSKRCGMAIFC
jgi:hypothetical protein